METTKQTISITSPQEQVFCKIAEEMQITDVQEFKFAFAIVCKVMAMYEDDGAEELLEEIQDITETVVVSLTKIKQHGNNHND